jgi:predicted protein tyrosine phosphatase
MVTDANVESYKHLYIISINDEYDGELHPYFIHYHPNVMNMSFPDLDHPVDGYSLFESWQARQIIEFLAPLRELTRFTLVVHCGAGVSRSGAVGVFAAEYLGCDMKDLYNRHPNILPNLWVLRMLRMLREVAENEEI